MMYKITYAIIFRILGELSNLSLVLNIDKQTVANIFYIILINKQ
uniref:Uncharacterized protein n=1 Tax=Bartonella rochalimae ATCC BAA-1498 TaxID=685782 RepID=E6YNN5_9HYPH|nr:hypothetical protein BARRO_130117 [Bartonella rochalimae ATCC BAA-1498]